MTSVARPLTARGSLAPARFHRWSLLEGRQQSTHLADTTYGWFRRVAARRSSSPADATYCPVGRLASRRRGTDHSIRSCPRTPARRRAFQSPTVRVLPAVSAPDRRWWLIVRCCFDAEVDGPALTPGNAPRHRTVRGDPLGERQPNRAGDAVRRFPLTAGMRDSGRTFRGGCRSTCAGSTVTPAGNRSRVWTPCGCEADGSDVRARTPPCRCDPIDGVGGRDTSSVTADSLVHRLVEGQHRRAGVRSDEESRLALPARQRELYRARRQRGLARSIAKEPRSVRRDRGSFVPPPGAETLLIRGRWC